MGQYLSIEREGTARKFAFSNIKIEGASHTLIISGFICDSMMLSQDINDLPEGFMKTVEAVEANATVSTLYILE